MDSNKVTINKSNFISYKKHSIKRDYKIDKSIGSGAYGTVKIATHKLTGQTRAIKVLKKSEQEEEKLFLEVEILSKLSHPNIMQVYEFYEDSTIFYIVSEYCSGGELFDYLTKKVIFSEKEASHIMKQILSAVCYSHDNNIVHRYL
jgi:calcium-dependent protein kinase